MVRARVRRRDPGRPGEAVPAEEMIWSKGYVQERERFDGADIAHLIRCRARPWIGSGCSAASGTTGGFSSATSSPSASFIRPSGTRSRRGSSKSFPPGWLTRSKGRRPRAQTCFGTLLSREQYLPDIGIWGYQDARLKPLGPMSPEEVAHWTAAIASAKE